jgi:Fur family ferric uptake transcriptional regulator
MSDSHKIKQSFAGQVSRVTAPRKAILDFLSRSNKHLSAKEIYVSLQESSPGLGLSTVYRTLDLLARTGIVTRISIGDGQSRYEVKSKRKDDHHHHLICIKCGSILNYSEFLEEELRLVRKTEEKLAKKYKYIIQDHNIEFLGICEQCQE